MTNKAGAAILGSATATVTILVINSLTGVDTQSVHVYWICLYLKGLGNILEFLC